FAWSLRRHFHRQAFVVLRPIEAVVMAKQRHGLDPLAVELRRIDGERFNHHRPITRPAEDERVERVAFGGEADVFSAVGDAIFVEHAARAFGRAFAEYLPWSSA